MNSTASLKNNKGFVFELDNVIYPEKDYLLQVYYLFAQFLEYTEQANPAEIVEFMKHYLETCGKNGIFMATAENFSIPLKYEDNLDRLYRNARLPLKLLLFKEQLLLMQEIIRQEKQLFLLVSGDPEMQLNKIRQIEWNGLEKFIKVYFLEELKGTIAEGLEMIGRIHGLERDELVFSDQII